MSLLQCLACVYGCAYFIQAECPSQTIEAIQRFWNGKPPKQILKSSVGTVTYVWMTRRFIQDKLNTGLLCMATNLAEDRETATDILIYKNRSQVADEISYWQKEKDGVITLHSHGEPDDTQYVLTYKDHVSTFWQCKNSPIVLITHMHSEASRAAVEEGKKVLDKLKLNTGSELPPCTERHVRVSAELQEEDYESVGSR